MKCGCNPAGIGFIPKIPNFCLSHFFSLQPWTVFRGRDVAKGWNSPMILNIAPRLEAYRPLLNFAPHSWFVCLDVWKQIGCSQWYFHLLLKGCRLLHAGVGTDSLGQWVHIPARAGLVLIVPCLALKSCNPVSPAAVGWWSEVNGDAWSPSLQDQILKDI